MLQYSAKKKKAKEILLCSVKNPATNSDSASGKSKGARFVSATLEIMNNNPIGKRAKNKPIGS